MTVVEDIDIPKLGKVSLDTRDNDRHLLKIVLSPDYHGDLNDLARNTPGPDEVYLECDEATAINNELLAKFMEVLTHHDYDGDGIPDCDAIINKIEEALRKSREIPFEFHRPRTGWYTNLVMGIMPPAPDRYIVFGFGVLQRRFRYYHHLAALPMLAVVIGLIQLQIHYLPWTKYSVVSGFTAIADLFGIAYWIAIVIFIVGLNVLSIRKRKTGRHSFDESHSRHTYGFFSKAAVFEEQAFREGSENWNFQQRVRSCIAFGAIHMINLIYPLAAILPLALGGGLFMFFYLRKYRSSHSRRAAVLDAAIWHRVYNRVALFALFASLVWLIGAEVLGLFGVFAALLVASAGFRTSIVVKKEVANLSILVRK